MREVVVTVLDNVVYGLWIDNGEEKVEVLSKTSVFDYHDCLFITYQVDELLHQIPFDDNVFPDILDFECLDHEIRQSVFGIDKEWKWSVSDMLKTYLGIDKKEWDENEKRDFIILLKKCYLKMKELGVSELERIKKIELPVNKILYKEQRKGIYFNITEAREKCKELHHDLYQIKNKIQDDYGIIIPVYENFAKLIGFSSTEPNHDKLKYYAKLHPELEDYRILQKAEKNYNTLMLIAASRADNNTCYPMIKPFGSSTGRIFLKEPSLQNMKKEYRRFLVDNSKLEKYKYVYFDYSQFEAGIIAGLTDNEELKNLYKEGLIYDTLAKKTGVNRDIAKTYFYIYTYGGIKASGAEDFFNHYCSSNILESLLKKSVKNGYVETSLGCRRMISPTIENKNWLMNHLIQGTSSLIFKQAIIDTNVLISPDERLLLPMHDGALYLLRKDKDTKPFIDKYKAAFTKWIPGMEPIVKEKNFFEE